MRQIFLTKEDLIRYLDPLDPSSRIEFDIQHEGKAYHVDHIRGFSRITDPVDGEMVCTLHLKELEEIYPLFAQCFRNSWKILTIVFHNLYPSCQQCANFQRLKGMGK